VAVVIFVMCGEQGERHILTCVCLYTIDAGEQLQNKKDLGDVLRDKENRHCVFLVFYVSAKWTTLTINSHIYKSPARKEWEVNPRYVWDCCRLLLMRAGMWEPCCNSVS